MFDPIQDWITGKVLYTFAQFGGFVNEIAARKDSNRERRRNLTGKMYRFRDGNSCKRIAEALGIHNEN